MSRHVHTHAAGALGLIALLGIACLFPPAGAARAGDWPHWRGPRSDGTSPETGLLRAWPESGPPLLWKVPLTGGYSSVAVAGGRLFTMTARAKKEEIVLCLDVATGRELWRYRYDCDYDRHPTLTERWDSGPRATPAVDGDRVYTIGTTGVVLCLDVRTGAKVWQRDLLELGGRKCPPFGYCGSPLVVGVRVYVQPGGPAGKSVAALDSRDGRTVWRALDAPPGYATPVWADVPGEPQVICFAGDCALGVAPADGTLLWRYPWRNEMERSLNATTPVYADGRVFLTSLVSGNGGSLLRLTGRGAPELVWKAKTMQSHYPTPVLYQGHLYGFSNVRLRCVDFATGRARWDVSGLGKGSLLVADGRLVILGGEGDLVLAEATPARYAEVSRCEPLDGDCLTAPALADGRLFVRNEKVLLALDLRDHGRGR
jgi:outer membrane protein assembly factor BamB